MNTLENKIAGAVYGFAIGDAMGATTEFMHSFQIKKVYGKVTDIVGGGWLMLEPGEVTDDTQMTMCVMSALMQTINNGQTEQYFFAEHLKDRFIEWYNTNPKDIGYGCQLGIFNLMQEADAMVLASKSMHNKNALGNGSLMRALPCALLGPNYEEWNTLQGRLTHNNNKCSRIILDYSRLVWNLINGGLGFLKENSTRKLLEPLGDIKSTYNNALYWAQKPTFYETIIGAVNDGGDADTIAAIAGSIAGAHYGINAIPSGLVSKLNPDIKIFLNKFINFTKKYVQTNQGVL